MMPPSNNRLSSGGPQFIPLTYFLRSLSRPLQWVLGVGYVLLLVLASGILWAEYHPWQAVLNMLPLPDNTTQEVILDQLQGTYRQLPFHGLVQSAYVNFAAPLIGVNIWLVLALALGQSAGWALLLAATSRVTAWWSYVVYFLFGVWVVNSNAAYVFIGGIDEYNLIALVLMLMLLVPAFLFRQRMWNASLAAQAGLFFGLMLLWFSVGYLRQGLGGVLHLAGLGWAVLVMMTVLFVLLFHRELLNIVLAAGTLHRNQQARQRGGVLLAVLVLVWVLELLMLLQHNGILPPSELFLRPSHLLVLTAIAGIWTIGNLYGTLQEQIPAVGAFYMGLLGLALIALATVLYAYGSGELLFRVLLADNLLRIFVVFHGLYILYLLLHFWGLLQQRANVYFGLMRTPRPSAVTYIVVWFIGTSLVFFLEGREYFRSASIARVQFRNISADIDLLNDADLSAAALYAAALQNAPTDPKANYNLAALKLRDDPTADVSEYYRDAESYMPFAPARLSHGNVLRARGKLREAKAAMQVRPDAPDAHVLVNLAAIHLRLFHPDSSLLLLEQAHTLAPSLVAVQTNLAFVYARMNRLAEARTTMQAALAQDPNDPFVLQNRIWLGLQADSLNDLLPPRTSATIPDTTLPASTRLNLAVLALRHRNFALADTLAATIEADVPEALWVRVASQAHGNQLERALSRVEYLASAYPGLSGLAAHAIGMAYFRHHVPEMGAPFLTEAAQYGRPVDSLYGAYLYADAGAADTAVRQLDALRAQRQVFWEVAKRESALLLRANGLAEQAVAEWDFADITYQEGLRLARFAGLAQHPEVATDILGQLVEADTSRNEPYLEMGRAFLASNQPKAAADNLNTGLAHKPTDSLRTLMQAELIRAYTLQQDWERARTAAAQPTDTANEDVRLARAELALALGNNSQALAQLERLYASNRWNIPVAVSLAQAYLAQNEFANGLTHTGNVLRWNNRNASLWEAHARLALAIQNEAEARFALEQALQYTYAPPARQALVQRYPQVLAGRR